MQKCTTARTALLALAATWAGSLGAHHSGSMYEQTPFWVQGTVVSFQPINPHTITSIEAINSDGEIFTWDVAGPPQSRVNRLGMDMDVPRVGDVIGFCAFPYKSPEELALLFPNADLSRMQARIDSGDSSRQSVSGHVMVTADGEKRLWESHGVIGQCIRSSDDTQQSWVDFLDANQRHRQFWCDQQTYALVQEDAALNELVDEINGLIDDPCL